MGYCTAAGVTTMQDGQVGFSLGLIPKRLTKSKRIGVGRKETGERRVLTLVLKEKVIGTRKSFICSFR